MSVRETDPPPRAARTMSPFAAVLWTLGTTAIFIYVLMITEAARKGAAGDVISGIAAQALAYLGAIFLMLRLYAPESSIRAFVALRPARLAYYPLALLLGAAASIPIDALYEAFERRFPTSSDDSLVTTFQSASSPMRIAIVLVLVAFGPLLEEIFFRGAIFNVRAIVPAVRDNEQAEQARTRSLPPWFTIALTATLFALAHLEWQKFLPLVLMGLVLGFLRETTGSLVPPLLMHAAFNAVPCYFLVARGAKPAEPDTPPPLWLVAATLIAAIALLIVIHLIGARKTRLTEESDPS